MISIRDLSAGYGRVEILRGIDLDIPEGQIVSVLGSNGAGKSTLNNVISGLVPVRTGSIRLLNENIVGLTSSQVVARGIIHVPEGRRVFTNLTVRENLEVATYRRGRADARSQLERVVEIFPLLKQRFKQKAGTLSGGEQQMLAIGRGLMAQPKVLILDEPSLGLSPLLVEEMFATIQLLNKGGLTILLVEQNVAQSLAISHSGYVIESGRIVASGPATKLQDDVDLRKAYLGM